MELTVPVKNETEQQLLQTLIQNKADLEALQTQALPTKPEAFSPFADKQFLLGSMLLLFGVVVLMIISRLIKQGCDSEALLRTFGTILIIVAAIFLIITGYDEQQIAPVIGLLGTIAGYLLGKTSNKIDKDGE